MGSRPFPRWLYGTALLLFFLTAILPLLVMVGPWLWRGGKDPQLLATALLDARQGRLLWRSLQVGLGVVTLSVLLGVPMAFLLAARDLPARRLFGLLVFVPLMIPPYVLAGAWIHVFSPLGGVNQWLTNQWGPEVAIRLQTLPGCVWCLAQSFCPIVILLVSSSLLGLDPSLLESSRLETKRWGVCRHVLWPQMRAHLLAAMCLVLVFSLVQYSVPSLLGIHTYPVEIFTQFSAFYDMDAAVATSLPLVLLVVGLILLQCRVMGSREHVRIRPSSAGQAPLRLGRWATMGAAALGLWLVMVLVWPFATVWRQAGGGRVVWATLCGHYDWMLYSSLLALGAGLLATGLGFVLGHLLAQPKRFGLSCLDIGCWLPIAWPGTVLGLAYIKLGTLIPRLQQTDTWGAWLLLAYVGLFTAFSVRVFQAHFRRSDPHVTELAALDGVHWWQRLWRIERPLATPAAGLSLMLVFVLAVGELNATVLLVPPGKTTLAVSIDNLLHYGASATASALCLLEAGLVLGVVGSGLGLMALGKRV